MSKQHHYTTNITWTGNLGEGTKNYRSYSRDHQVIIKDKTVIEASSDAAFMGDAAKHNPEELFLASLAACHMLWYLHICADNGITVTGYTDKATAVMEENEKGGCFTAVTLHPQVTITDSAQIEKANALHQEANRRCYIANSCNFPVHHLAECMARSH